MGYLITIRGQKHSYWDNFKDAEKQVTVLKDTGYKCVDCQTLNCTYANGFYFV